MFIMGTAIWRKFTKMRWRTGCRKQASTKQQYPIKVYDEDGTLIGDYLADLLVEGELIIELKTAKALAPEHEAQILG